MSSRSRSRSRGRDQEGTRLFVGGLDDRLRKEELQKEFEHHGRVIDIWVARNPPGILLVF